MTDRHVKAGVKTGQRGRLTWTLSLWTSQCEHGDAAVRLCLQEVCYERPAGGGRARSFNTRNVVLFFPEQVACFYSKDTELCK